MTIFINSNVDFKKYESNDYKIPEIAYVKYKGIKNYPVIIWSKFMNNEIKIRKLDKDRYIYLPTGEIMLSNHIKNRSEAINEVIISVGKTRDLLNHNFEGHINEKWIILTYKENMIDVKKLYNDTKNFIAMLRRKYGWFEYVIVPEPQGRGAWHINLIAKFRNNPGKLDNNNIIEPMWGYGWTKIKRIYNSVGLGIYLSVYLTDLEFNDNNVKLAWESGMKLDDINKTIDRIVEGKSKKFIKGARLYLYPPHFRMFRKSKGIFYPPEDEGGYKEIKKRNNLEKVNPSYGNRTSIYDDDAILVNEIIRENYNLKVL